MEARTLLDGASAFATGDLLIGVTSGIQWRHANGALVDTLASPAAFNAGMAFDRQGNLLVSGFSQDQINKFGPNGQLLGPLGSTIPDTPQSIVFDAAGRAYVGQADGAKDVLKLDARGNIVQVFDVAVEAGGANWLDLSSDQRTLFYTSEGDRILRYDLVRGKQLADFATDLPGSRAFAIRCLPDGGVLVADSEQIHRLNAAGTIIKSYDLGSNNDWFALNLDPDGRSFWSADRVSGVVARFDLRTGDVLASFSAGSGMVYGLAVRGELTLAQSADLTVTSVAAPSLVGPRAFATYSILVKNDGPGTATGVVVTDTLSGGRYASAKASDGTRPSVSGNVVRFALGSIPAGESVLVTVVARAPARGTIKNALVATTTANPTQRARLTQTSTVVAAPPKVVKFARRGVHENATVLSLQFNQAMNAQLAQTMGNYLLTHPGRDGIFGTGDDVSMKLRSARYNSRTRTVDLVTRARLSLHQIYRLTVNGDFAGLTNTLGVLLDGNGDGRPGGNYRVTFRGFGPLAANRSARTSR